jgi:hypothetical protein
MELQPGKIEIAGLMGHGGHLTAILHDPSTLRLPARSIG